MPSQATRALVEYVTAQIDQIENGDAELLHAQGPDPDCIHDTRVAVRRFRSTMRVFKKSFDGPNIAGLDGELKWFAGLLGEVRDCQVQRDRFNHALDRMPDELVLGPVRARIRNELQEIERPARACLNEAMKSDRHQALLSVLRGWRDEPPIGQDIATKTLLKRARRAERKADRRLAAALRSNDDAMVHRARKAAKRARYAAEAVQPVFGPPALRLARRLARLQSVLGEHQDAVITRGVLRDLAAGAQLAHENAFAYGVLYEREDAEAAALRREARRAWRKASRRRHLRWLG